MEKILDLLNVINSKLDKLILELEIPGDHDDDRIDPSFVDLSGKFICRVSQLPEKIKSTYQFKMFISSLMLDENKISVDAKNISEVCQKIASYYVLPNLEEQKDGTHE